MSIESAPKSSVHNLRNLYNFVEGQEDDVRSLPIEEVRKELQSKKVDISPLLGFVEKQLISERLRLASEKRTRIDTLLSKLASKASGGQSIRELVLNELRKRPQMAVAYRKLEDVSDDDLPGLLEDLGILELLDDSDDSH